MHTNKTIKYIHYRHKQTDTSAFISKKKEGRVCVLPAKNWAPLNKGLNPLTAAEKQLSVKYKRARYIRRLQRGECECVCPCSYSHAQLWQSGVNENLFLGNIFDKNQGQESILSVFYHLFLIVFSPRAPTVYHVKTNKHNFNHRCYAWQADSSNRTTMSMPALQNKLYTTAPLWVQSFRKKKGDPMGFVDMSGILTGEPHVLLDRAGT